MLSEVERVTLGATKVNRVREVVNHKKSFRLKGPRLRSTTETHARRSLLTKQWTRPIAASLRALADRARRNILAQSPSARHLRKHTEIARLHAICGPFSGVNRPKNGGKARTGDAMARRIVIGVVGAGENARAADIRNAFGFSHC
jgi:hypothetical protein